MHYEWAKGIATAILVYAAIGIVFALAFVTRGAPRFDENARGSGIGFRLLILPGAALLWPLLLVRWARGATSPAVEKNAHRHAAGERAS